MLTLSPDDIALAEGIRNILQEQNGEFFERRDALDALWKCLLAAEHSFILGPPGTAKSMMARAITGRIDGARYWEKQLHRQLPVESVFGPVDIKAFEDTGDWHHKVAGTAAEAHLAFLDEIGKSGPTVTDPLLTWLMDRKFHNNNQAMDCPLISAVCASNEQLEFPAQAALHDRFMLRLEIDYIQEPGNFIALLGTAVQDPNAQPQPRTTIPLEELQRVVSMVIPRITIPPGVMDSVLQLRADLRGEDIVASDRRWVKGQRFLQASAFVEGRGAVDDDDLSIYRHILWDVPEQISMVEKKVLALTSPLTRKALEFQTMLEEIEQGINERKGQSVQTRAEYGGEAKYKADNIQKSLNDLIEQANRQGRSTIRLQGIEDQVKALKVRIFVECLNVPQAKAEQMGA